MTHQAVAITANGYAGLCSCGKVLRTQLEGGYNELQGHIEIENDRERAEKA